MTTHGYSTRLCSTRLQHQCMTSGQDTSQRHRCNKTPQRCEIEEKKLLASDVY